MIPIHGGNGTYLQPDATCEYEGSVDNDVEFVVRSKSYVPSGSSGDFVARRVHLLVDHDTVFSGNVRVVLDGTVILDASIVSTSKGNTKWMLPVQITGSRGREVVVEFRAQTPRCRWHIRELWLEYKSGKSGAN